MKYLHPLLLSLALLAPASSMAKQPKTTRVDCDRAENTLARAVDKADAGDTLVVSGTCTENVVIDKTLTLDGQGTASIRAADPNGIAVMVLGRDVVLQGLRLESPATVQVATFGPASARVQQSVLRNATLVGVSATGGSVLTLVRNTISDNPTGVLIADNATGRVGLIALTDTSGQPNLIERNPDTGVAITSGGVAEVAGNQIRGSSIGVAIVTAARARIASNLIEGNRFGILSNTNATVQLADLAPDNPLLGTPNSGINTVLAILCQGGSISGRVGGFGPTQRVGPPPGSGVLGGVPLPPAGLTFCRDQTTF